MASLCHHLELHHCRVEQPLRKHSIYKYAKYAISNYIFTSIFSLLNDKIQQSKILYWLRPIRFYFYSYPSRPTLLTLVSRCANSANTIMIVTTEQQARLFIVLVLFEVRVVLELQHHTLVLQTANVLLAIILHHLVNTDARLPGKWIFENYGSRWKWF